MSGVIVGVDLGGTKTAAALVAPDGSVGEIVRTPSRAADGPAAVLDAVAEVVRSVTAGKEIAGIGIGTAGAVDARRGGIVSATDVFPGWVGTDIPAGLRARVGEVPVVVHNDVDAHLLGEAWQGAASGFDSVLMIAAGTGIGGALMLSGQLITGAHHLAGEVGHIPTVGAEGLRCGCGRDGHLEALAAGPAIWRRYTALGGIAEDTREIVALAARGEGLATRVVVDAAAGLGRAIAGLVTCVDPGAVIIGGGLGEAGGLWWDTLVATIRAELVDALADIPVLHASLGNNAAIVGAASPFFTA